MPSQEVQAMRTLHPTTAALGSALVLITWSHAFAWDDLGHTVVCEIAFQELNDKARQEVSWLIAADTNSRPSPSHAPGLTTRSSGAPSITSTCHGISKHSPPPPARWPRSASSPRLPATWSS